jgi:hypothetical protein
VLEEWHLMSTPVRLIAAFAVTLLVGLSPLAVPAPTKASPTPASSSAAAPQPTIAPVTKVARTSARRCRVPYCYGAISMSPDRAYGYYVNSPRRKWAVQKAHRRCKAESGYPGYCRKMGSIGNGCMAVAIKTNSDGWITHWKTGFGRSLKAAKRQAHRRLAGWDKIRAALCTTRRY